MVFTVEYTGDGLTVEPVEPLAEPFKTGVKTLEVVACRLAAGVAKKSAADLFTVDGGGRPWGCGGGWDCEIECACACDCGCGCN